MADFPDFTGNMSDPNPVTPESMATWINGAQARLATGQSLDNSGAWDPAHGKFGLPTAYKVENGRLVQDTNTWSSIYKGLLGTAGMATLGLLVGPSLAGGPTLEASMNAGVNATTAAPAAASVPAAAATTTAATATPSLAKTLTGLAPLGATITNRLMNPSPSGSGVSSIDPALLSRLSQMLDLAQRRATSAQPVHDAAMMMAQRMAPTYGDSPRLNTAIQQSTNPLPTGDPSAAMLAAYQKLAGR